MKGDTAKVFHLLPSITVKKNCLPENFRHECAVTALLTPRTPRPAREPQSGFLWCTFRYSVLGPIPSPNSLPRRHYSPDKVP